VLVCQVGMRHFHILKNRSYCKTVNVDKLWSMLGEEVLEKAKGGGQAPVLDITKMVRFGWPGTCSRGGQWGGEGGNTMYAGRGLWGRAAMRTSRGAE
jgi:hypothetical protein